MKTRSVSKRERSGSPEERKVITVEVKTTTGKRGRPKKSSGAKKTVYTIQTDGKPPKQLTLVLGTGEGTPKSSSKRGIYHMVYSDDDDDDDDDDGDVEELESLHAQLKEIQEKINRFRERRKKRRKPPEFEKPDTTDSSDPDTPDTTVPRINSLNCDDNLRLQRHVSDSSDSETGNAPDPDDEPDKIPVGNSPKCLKEQTSSSVRQLFAPGAKHGQTSETDSSPETVPISNLTTNSSQTNNEAFSQPDIVSQSPDEKTGHTPDEKLQTTLVENLTETLPKKVKTRPEHDSEKLIASPEPDTGQTPETPDESRTPFSQTVPINVEHKSTPEKTPNVITGSAPDTPDKHQDVFKKQLHVILNKLEIPETDYFCVKSPKPDRPDANRPDTDKTPVKSPPKKRLKVSPPSTEKISPVKEISYETGNVPDKPEMAKVSKFPKIVLKNFNPSPSKDIFCLTDSDDESKTPGNQPDRSPDTPERLKIPRRELSFTENEPDVKKTTSPSVPDKPEMKINCFLPVPDKPDENTGREIEDKVTPEIDATEMSENLSDGVTPDKPDIRTGSDQQPNTDISYKCTAVDDIFEVINDWRSDDFQEPDSDSSGSSGNGPNLTFTTDVQIGWSDKSDDSSGSDVDVIPCSVPVVSRTRNKSETDSSDSEPDVLWAGIPVASKLTEDLPAIPETPDENPVKVTTSPKTEKLQTDNHYIQEEVQKTPKKRGRPAKPKNQPVEIPPETDKPLETLLPVENTPEKNTEENSEEKIEESPRKRGKMAVKPANSDASVSNSADESKRSPVLKKKAKKSVETSEDEETLEQDLPPTNPTADTSAEIKDEGVLSRLPEHFLKDLAAVKLPKPKKLTEKVRRGGKSAKLGGKVDSFGATEFSAVVAAKSAGREQIAGGFKTELLFGNRIRRVPTKSLNVIAAKRRFC